MMVLHLPAGRNRIARSGARVGLRRREVCGSGFTVDSLGRYFLHDVVHHLHDLGHG
jgi:hypothetical protein